MGGKQNGFGKHLYFCIAGLALLSACAAWVETTPRREAEVHLREAENLLVEGDFDGSLIENQRVLALNAKRPPADEALFNMGVLYGHPENPKKDLQKAVGLFRRLIDEYPDNPWAERAKIWTGLLDGLASRAGYGRPQQEAREAFRGVKPAEEAPAPARDLGQQRQAREHLRLAEEMLAKGDYDGALKENQAVLSNAGKGPPADEALFNMGMIQAHPANPKKDPKKAIALMRQLVKEYPQSFWVERAKAWAGILENFEKAKKVDIEVEQKKREQAR